MNLYESLVRKYKKHGFGFGGKDLIENEFNLSIPPFVFIEKVLHDVILKNSIEEYINEIGDDNEITVYSCESQLSGKYVCYVMSMECKIFVHPSMKRKYHEISEKGDQTERDEESKERNDGPCDINIIETEYVDNNKQSGYIKLSSKHPNYYADKVFPLTLISRVWNNLQNNERTTPTRLVEYLEAQLKQQNMVSLCDMICKRRESNHNYSITMSLKITEGQKQSQIVELRDIMNSMKDLKQSVLEMQGRLKDFKNV